MTVLIFFMTQENQPSGSNPTKNEFEIDGIVEEALPSATFRVRATGDNSLILAHLSGKMRMNYIRVLPGDKVIVEVSPYDKTKGRIIKRLK